MKNLLSSNEEARLHQNRTIDIAIARNHRSKELELKKLTLEEFCKLHLEFKTVKIPFVNNSIEQSIKAGKKQLRAFITASFNNNTRNNENVLSRSAITLDIDNYDKDLNTLEMLLKQEFGRFYYAAYTTISHTPEKPRLRVVIFLTKDIQLEEEAKDKFKNLDAKYKHIVENLIVSLPTLSGKATNGKAIIDEASKVLSQLMIFPYEPVMEGCESFKYEKWGYINEGELLNPDEFINTSEVKKQDTLRLAVDNTKPQKAATKKPLKRTIPEIKAILAKYPAAGYNENWIAVGMALHHQFSGGEEGLNIWDEWSKPDAKRYKGREDLQNHWKDFKNNKDNLLTFATIEQRGEEKERENAQLVQTKNNKFFLKDDGLYLETITSKGLVKQVWLSDTFTIKAFLNDEKNSDCSKLLSFRNNENEDIEIIIPMQSLAGSGSEAHKLLLKSSMKITAQKQGRDALNDFLCCVNPEAKMTIVDKAGWTDDKHYILKYKQKTLHIYFNKESKKYTSYSNATRELTKKGTLEGWQEKVEAYLKGNTNLLFSVLVAFAPIFLKKKKEENAVFHLVGPSSIGKTTALSVANSIWGCELSSWRTTSNAAEGICRQANDGFLPLDELSQANANEVGAMVYMLGNGVGKTRMTKNIEISTPTKFSLFCLSTGETGIAAKMQEKDKTAEAKGGHTVRLIELPADAGKGYGVFDALHSFNNAAELAKYLKEVSNEYCGTPIDAFLRYLEKDSNLQNELSNFNNHKKEWKSKNLTSQVDGQVERVADKFAFIYAVGKIVIKSGVLKTINQEDVEKTCSEVFSRWVDTRGGTGSHEVKTVIDRLREFIHSNSESRFIDFGGEFPRTIHKAAGFKQKISTLGKGTDDFYYSYYFYPDIFKKEIIQSSNEKYIISELVKKGYIIPGSDKKNTQSKKTKIHGQKRLFVTNPDKFFEMTEEMGVSIYPPDDEIDDIPF